MPDVWNCLQIGCFLATCYVAASLIAYVLLKDAVDPGWTAQDSGYITLSFVFLVLLMASLCASVIRIVDRDHRDEEAGREGDRQRERQALLSRNKDASVNRPEHPMFYTLDGSEYPVAIEGLPEI